MFATFAVPTLVFLGLFFGFFGGNNWEGWIPLASVELGIGFAKTLLGVFAFEWAGESAFFMVITILSIGVLLLAVIFGEWRSNWTLLAVALFYVAQVLAYSLVIRSIFWYRPLLPALIPLFAFVARQIASTRPRPLQIAGLLSVLVVSGIYTSFWIGVEAAVPGGH